MTEKNKLIVRYIVVAQFCLTNLRNLNQIKHLICKMLLFIQVFMLLTELSYCQNKTFICWITISNDGYHQSLVMAGDPYDYLPYLEAGIFKSTDYYRFMRWRPYLNALDQSVACDGKNEFMAVSKNKFRLIVIYSNIISNSSPVKHNIGFLPLSNNVSGLAMAVNFNLLYWIDPTFQYIGVIHIINLKWTSIIDSDLVIPYSLAVHETNRFLFWSDLGFKPKIERSNLFGKERTVIADSSLNKPISLALDYQRNKLCWIDKNLQCSDFQGKNVVTYELYDKPDFLKSFVIHKDIAIIGTNSSMTLCYKMYDNNTFSLFTKYLYPGVTSTVYGSIDPREVLPPNPNPCHGTSCDHICFPHEETTFMCGCRFGYFLKSDGSTCSQSNFWSGSILVSDKSHKMVYQVHPISGDTQVVLNLDPDTLKNFAYVNSTREAFIYYVLQERQDIMQYKISNETKSLYYRSTIEITNLIADQSSGVLYLSDADNKIQAVESSLHVSTVCASVGRISRLYFHSHARRLFYCDCNMKSIVEVNVDNNKEVRKFQVGICVSSFVVDLKNGKIYFGDGSPNIFSQDISDSPVKQLFYNAKENISDLAMDDEFLYIIENMNQVRKVNKETAKASHLTRHIFREAETLLLMDYVPSMIERFELASAQIDKGLIIGLSVAGGVLLIAAVAFAIGMLVKCMKKRNDSKTHYELSVKVNGTVEGHNIQAESELAERDK